MEPDDEGPDLDWDVWYDERDDFGWDDDDEDDDEPGVTSAGLDSSEDEPIPPGEDDDEEEDTLCFDVGRTFTTQMRMDEEVLAQARHIWTSLWNTPMDQNGGVDPAAPDTTDITGFVRQAIDEQVRRYEEQSYRDLILGGFAVEHPRPTVRDIAPGPPTVTRRFRAWAESYAYTFPTGERVVGHPERRAPQAPVAPPQPLLMTRNEAIAMLREVERNMREAERARRPERPTLYWLGAPAATPITPEQRAREAAEHAERVRVGREFLERRKAANAVARELLFSHLSAEQRAEFDGTHKFSVTGGETGRHYKLAPLLSYNIEWWEAGDCVAMYCAVPVGGLPVGDQLLAQKLWLEGTHERQFLATANRFYGPAPRGNVVAPGLADLSMFGLGL